MFRKLSLLLVVMSFIFMIGCDWFTLPPSGGGGTTPGLCADINCGDNETCDDSTGICECDPGYEGDSCEPSPDSLMWVTLYKKVQGTHISELATIDLNTGEVNIIGTYEYTDSNEDILNQRIDDITFDSQGNLYGVSPFFLWEIDKATAQVLKIHENGDQWYGSDYKYTLAFAQNDTLYAAGSYLDIVNIENTELTRVGTYEIEGPRPEMEFFNNKFYLMTTPTEGPDVLSTINLNIGSHTELNQMTTSNSPINALGASSDTLYAAYKVNSDTYDDADATKTYTNTLLIIDEITGEATEMNFGECSQSSCIQNLTSAITGIAFQESP